MFGSLLRLFALRPFLTMGILGFPLLLLVAVGLLTIWVLKFFVFIVLPIAVVVWLFRKLTRSSNTDTM